MHDYEPLSEAELARARLLADSPEPAVVVQPSYIAELCDEIEHWRARECDGSGQVRVYPDYDDDDEP